jgi:hypothetical protein
VNLMSFRRSVLTALVAMSPVWSSLEAQTLVGRPAVAAFAAEPIAGPWAAYLRDVTNDGLLDFLYAPSWLESIACLPGLPSGGFGPPIRSFRAAASTNYQVAVDIRLCWDLNADGFLDLVAVAGGSTVEIWRGTGNGNFQVVASLGIGVQSVGSGDFNFDGIPEIVVRTTLCSGTVTFCCWKVLDVQGLAFNQAAEIPDPGVSYLDYPVAGDFDGDGFSDIAVLPHPNLAPVATGHWYRNGATPQLTFSSAGSFMTRRSMQSAVTTQSRSATDINGDGYDDVLVMGPQPREIAVTLGGPFGLASTPVLTSFDFGGSNLVTYHLADLDQDGNLDLWFEDRQPTLTPWLFTQTWHLLSAGDDGAFTPVESRVVPPSYFRSFPIAADLEGDGDIDFLQRRQGPETSTPTLVTAPMELAWIENLSIYGGGVSGSAGTPRMRRSRPLLGNAGFFVSVDNARPGSLAILGIATAAQPTGTQPGGLWLSTLPGELLYPAGPYGLFMTDATGTATAPLPLPLIPSADGLVFYGQWGVLDPAGSYSSLGPLISLSDAHQVVLYY